MVKVRALWTKWIEKIISIVRRKPTIIIYVLNDKVEQVISDCPGMRVVVIDYNHKKYQDTLPRYMLDSRSIVVICDEITHHPTDQSELVYDVINSVYKRQVV